MLFTNIYSDQNYQSKSAFCILYTVYNSNNFGSQFNIFSCSPSSCDTKQFHFFKYHIKWLFCTLLPSVGFVARNIAPSSISISVSLVKLMMLVRMTLIMKLCDKIEIVHFSQICAIWKIDFAIFPRKKVNNKKQFYLSLKNEHKEQRNQYH